MSRTTPLNIAKDINGNPVIGNISGLQFSTLNQYFNLISNQVTSVTVPEGAQAYVAIMSYTEFADIWVSPVESPTLTVPGNIVLSTLAQKNPQARIVYPGQVLQFLYSEDQESDILITQDGDTLISEAGDAFITQGVVVSEDTVLIPPRVNVGISYYSIQSSQINQVGFANPN